jgi:hypothetical protein
MSEIITEFIHRIPEAGIPKKNKNILQYNPKDETHEVPGKVETSGWVGAGL